MNKDELQIKIGVKIADTEFENLKQYENENEMLILQHLANNRYLLLQKLENKIYNVFEALQNIMPD